jgi:Tfp pilus assembly protein PilV
VSRLRRLVRREDGMGMIELLTAMTVLNVGIFAVLSAFTSGYTAMSRTKAVTSGSVLMDQQRRSPRARLPRPPT